MLSVIIKYDGLIELEELQITRRQGVVYLEGFVPSEGKKQILLDILQDNMGLENIVDHVTTEQLLWQREDRTSSEIQPEKEEKALFEGEEDVDSEEEGLPKSPADRLIPERKKQ